jgi:diguanylate cyclase (GGDEF)-like protein/PAS domain S-box-containing protein
MEDGARVMYANDAACLHFGVSRATLLTWRPANWNPYFDASDMEALYRTLKSGDSVVFETEHRVASGELVPVEVMLLCQARDGGRIAIGYTRDIRVRKAEQAQRLEYERNETEQAGLRRLSRFIDNTPGYFYTVIQRPDGSIAMPFASPGIQEIYGLLPKDVEQDVSRLVATIHSDDEVKNIAAMAESARTMSPFHVEFRVHHPEKGGRWVEARSQPQREPDGSVLWHGFAHDITERKRTELALAASKQEFRILAENLPDSIVRYDRNARHVYLNPSARRELAFGTSALPSAAFDELWEETPAGAFYRRKVQQVLETASPVEFEFIADPLPGKSKSRYYHVHVVPEYSYDGQLIGALGLAHNITERKQAETMLIQREREFHSLVENLPDNLVRWDREGRYLYVNAIHESTLRVPAADVLGKTISEAFPDGRFAQAEQAIATVIETGRPQRLMRQPVPQEDGSVQLHEVSLTPEWNAHGEIVGVLAIGRDMTEQFRLQEAIAAREQELRALAESSPGMMGSFHLRPDGTVCMPYVAPNIWEHFGLHPQDVVDDASPLLMRNHPDDARRVMESIAESARTMLPWREEYRILHPTRGERWMENHTKPQPHPDGGIVWHGYVCDITERKRMEELLCKREQEFRALVENSPDTIARYDRDCRLVYANPKLAADMGGDPGWILGTIPAQFPDGASALEYENMLRQVCERGEERNFELRWKTGDVEFCTQVRMTPEFDGSGVAHVLAVGRDITEIDQYRKQIHHQAFSDALTGLPNRTLLSDRIRQAIADAGYHGHQFGLMMLDLDNFKEINDTMGHGVGDELLRIAAQRLLACVRSYDTVGRLGGDEFSVLLPNMRRGDDLATIAGKILSELAEPFVLDGQELFVTCSIGIALYPSDSTQIDALYKYADSAMYHAKKMGRNNFQFYEPEFTVRSQERMELEAALRKAQKNGELVLYYQPQIELQTGRLVSAEALLRWQRPGHGMVAPDRFIPIAEASGLILGIGEWVLLNACQDAVCWNRDRETPVRVAVNLSTRQFIRNDLVGTVRRTLDQTGCKAAWLELEITESLLLEDSSEVAAMLAALHGMGLSISIDDFGTGYSALSYLNRFPVSQIKIDRSFVNEIPAQQDKCELVKAILSIATALKLGSVAEGVETIEQAEYLTAHGCRLAQGYLFGRPMPLAEFESVLAQADTCSSDETMVAAVGADGMELFSPAS